MINLPGAQTFPESLRHSLQAKLSQFDSGYKARTRHLIDGRAKYTNRLLLETSPYLQQHAHNPVNWFPWGEDAFETAKVSQRPILLSIGYSTCHWCHVMEEESFEDEEIASFLNTHYVAIKVDREERPDVDGVYMTALQVLGIQGGWPLNVFLTPDLKPFFAGTYFPPRDGVRGAQHGFLSILRHLEGIFRTDIARIRGSAAEVANAVSETFQLRTRDLGSIADILYDVAKYCREEFDFEYGGIGSAPKFPSSTPLGFLARYVRRFGDQDSFQIFKKTLMQIAAGGIRDHVGGGFHRYSTDRYWLVPHFEKMLYDNALLVCNYLEAFQLTGDVVFKEIVEETLAYVSREMLSPDGGFYSASDADSLGPDGEIAEGYYFSWTVAEIKDFLGEHALAFCTYYGVREGGNFEGRSLLHTSFGLEEVASKFSMSAIDFKESLKKSCKTLYDKRRLRPEPLLDRKSLTSWNALMISAYARASLALASHHYLERAEVATEFILNKLYVEGVLYRSFLGEAKHPACLEDYACLIASLLDVFEAGGKLEYLRVAIELEKSVQEYFEDSERGGFYRTDSRQEKLFAREKPSYDGAEPSGNSVHALNLLRLAKFTTLDVYRQRAVRIFEGFSAVLKERPMALSEMLLALDFYLGEVKEIVIVTSGSRLEAEPFLEELRARFLPNRVLCVLSEGDIDEYSRLIPFVAGKGALAGKACAYICKSGVCELPTDDSRVFAKQLG